MPFPCADRKLSLSKAYNLSASWFVREMSSNRNVDVALGLFSDRSRVAWERTTRTTHSEICGGELFAAAIVV